ncbi:haloacid dehalogenase-like hydrolase domain-containing protein 2 [Pleurotus eryngii]|uniref:Haloacid dehalogenase-like hydrolase domain-containing protein 2 n=1 Tax=Pleurotus eryngii TaxID=5323 RepID=A0A9P6DG21_PLEER|nr:haloacid dehalogenase-like hydrolase domain-containing protein 2 [Pleurotus eryngii]
MVQRPLITALLIDLSGTIHVGSRPTPGAVEAIAKLRDYGVPFRFFSNTSKESTAAAKWRLTQMGIAVRDIDDGGGNEELWTSIGAVKRCLQSLGVRRPYLLLSDSAKEEIDTLLAHDNAGSPPYDDDHDYDAVVVGLAPNDFDYDHLNTAFRILTGEHSSRSPLPSPSNDNSLFVPLIATHRAKYLESASPPGLSLGPGPFVAALEYAADVQAHVVGKPTKEFFGAVIGSLPQDVREAEGRIAIIGDDVEADLGGGAIELGLWRVLVRTGKYRPGDEHRHGVAPPDEVYHSLAEFVDTLLGSPS